LFSRNKLVNPLVLMLLIEMMIATGPGVSFGDLAGVLKNAGLLASSPRGIGELRSGPRSSHSPFISDLDPMVAAGFLLVAVGPAAPFAPPLTAMAKGNVHVSVGLMVILASAILAS
jgi:BASS family bile acid:Na+ symporter